MDDKFTKWLKISQKLIPALIGSISIAVIVLNYLVLQISNSLIFDPLFYIPIILVAYYYPRQGVMASTAFAGLYIAMVALIQQQSTEIMITVLEHAGLFIIIGSTASYLTIRAPEDVGGYKYLSRIVDPSRIKVLFIPAFIVIITAIIIFLNFLVVQISHSVIFDPLFYLPIILIAYFYPKRGVTAIAAIATLYLATVMLVPFKSLDIFFTSIGHAAIFIIIGYVISNLSISFSEEEAIHRRLAEIVVYSSNAIIGETVEGIVTDWNKGAEDLYGYTAEEMIGRSINLLLPPDRHTEITTMLEKIRHGESIVEYETERMTKQGRRISVSVSISPIKNDRGAIVGASAITHDITDRKRMEDALRQANRQLNLMTSITRHDILNNIQGMLAYLEILESKKTDPDTSTLLAKLNYATKMIQTQIEFTRIYQNLGAHEPQWQKLDRVIPLSQVSSHITLTTEVNGVEVYADPMLEKVFYNLLDNTVRYGLTVTVIRVFYSDSQEGLTVIYEDNGIGIPTDEKKRIFERGYGKNTGLGLFLAREILAITGMTIRETGVPEKGARFEINIPKGKYRIAENSKGK